MSSDLSQVLTRFSRDGDSNLAEILAAIPDHQHTCPACQERYACSDEECRGEEEIYEREHYEL